MADWDKAKAAALKILGDKAKVPDLAPTISKASKAYDTASAAFTTSQQDCESKLLDLQNNNDALGNAVKQFSASIEKSSFGLNEKDDAKKLQQARKILLSELAGATKTISSNDKIIEELDKHLIQLGKYKSPQDMIS